RSNGNSVISLALAYTSFRSTNELRRLTSGRAGRVTGNRDEVWRLLEAEAPTLRLIQEAMVQPGCELLTAPLWSTNGVEDPGWSQLGRLAALEIEIRAIDQSLSNALSQGLGLVRLGHRLENAGGTTRHYLNAHSMKQAGLALLRRLASDHQAAPDQLVQISQELTPLSANLHGLSNAIRWDHQFGWLDLSNSVASAAGVGGATLYGPLFDPTRTQQKLAMQSARALESLELTYREAAVRSPGETNRSVWLLMLKGNAAGEILAEIAGASSERLSRLKCSENNSVAMTRIMLAVRAFQLTKGRSPTDLRELVPEYLVAVPTDDFDGQPLRYSSKDTRVWSVSENLRDDGGVPQDQAKNRLDDILKLEPSKN
ncbi:MAG TPA: hypothetical protein PLX89_11380, partial [Verrucomicrobiota bacterium]|nr:hypothetical protein [Verrucomicrobiota bacterium]